VDRDSQRFHHRSTHRWQTLGQFEQAAHRQLYELGHAAIHVESEQLETPANMRIAGATNKASATRDQRVGSDEVSNREIGSGAADLNNGAAELVADGERCFGPGMRPSYDGNVGTAKTTRGNLDQCLFVSYLWQRYPNSFHAHWP
jgi:hypothetical protein